MLKSFINRITPGNRSLKYTHPISLLNFPPRLSAKTACEIDGELSKEREYMYYTDAKTI